MGSRKSGFEIQRGRPAETERTSKGTSVSLHLFTNLVLLVFVKKGNKNVLSNLSTPVYSNND